MVGGVGSRTSPAGFDWMNAKQFVCSAGAVHRAAVLPAWLLEEYMHHLKCLFAVWALASRPFAADQAIK